MYRSDGPEELRPVCEVEFVQGLAAASASGLYGPCQAAAAIVGHANLNLGERVEPVLEALQAASPNRFRGVRHSVTWDPHPEVPNTAAHQMQDQLANEKFRAGILRVCQESLANVMRHANASKVSVTLTFGPALVCLAVQDDGVGFDANEVKRIDGQGGFGLTGMAQRAEQLGGNLLVNSEQGGGTRVEVRIPK